MEKKGENGPCPNPPPPIMKEKQQNTKNISAQSLSPLFSYPSLGRGADLDDEEDITEVTKNRDWYLFYTDACVLKRRNAKSRLENHFDDRFSRRRTRAEVMGEEVKEEEKVVVEYQPPVSLEVVRSHKLNESFQKEMPYTKHRSLADRRAALEERKRRKLAVREWQVPRSGCDKVNPTHTTVTFEVSIIHRLEVGEFYEVDGVEDSVDFKMPENLISARLNDNDDIAKV
jgi:hypothetical protein